MATAAAPEQTSYPPPPATHEAPIVAPAAPASGIAPAPVPASAPVATAPAHTNATGPVNDDDINYWKNSLNKKFNNVGETIKSKSPETASDWSFNIFSCCAPADTCFISCCCPCITFGKTHHRIAKNGSLAGYETINTSCLLFLASMCVGLPFIPLAMQRQDIREKYHLKGSCLTDLVLSACCGCCVLVQDDKEAAAKEKLIAEGTQYSNQGQGMVYAPEKV